MGSQKRVFIGLLSLCTLVLAALACFLLYSILHAERPLLQGVLVGIALLAVLCILLFGLGLLLVVIALLAERPLGRAGKLLYRITLHLYPFAMGLGRLFGIPQERIQGSFVEVNNRLVRALHCTVPPERLVVLAPHCLQYSDCPHKVTLDANNCARCGRCDIAALLRLCGQCGAHLLVVTGGTIARQSVRQLRPAAVVAIACERDLSSGIMDVLPLPALGVGNTRPEGPCRNTRVNPEHVAEAITFFIESALS